MAQLDDMLQRLKSRIPLDTQYPFEDITLEQYINDAINQHNPQYSSETLPESEEYLVVWLALINVYLTLAAQYAEDFNIKANGGEFDMEQPHIHYLNLARRLEEQYSTIARPQIEVSTATRVGMRYGRKTGLFPGDFQ